MLACTEARGRNLPVELPADHHGPEDEADYERGPGDAEPLHEIYPQKGLVLHFFDHLLRLLDQGNGTFGAREGGSEVLFYVMGGDMASPRRHHER